MSILDAKELIAGIIKSGVNMKHLSGIATKAGDALTI